MSSISRKCSRSQIKELNRRNQAQMKSLKHMKVSTYLNGCFLIPVFKSIGTRSKRWIMETILNSTHSSSNLAEVRRNRLRRHSPRLIGTGSRSWMTLMILIRTLTTSWTTRVTTMRTWTRSSSNWELIWIRMTMTKTWSTTKSKTLNQMMRMLRYTPTNRLKIDRISRRVTRFRCQGFPLEASAVLAMGLWSLANLALLHQLTPVPLDKLKKKKGWALIFQDNKKQLRVKFLH